MKVKPPKLILLLTCLLFCYGFMVGGQQLVLTRVCDQFGIGVVGMGTMVAILHVASMLAPGIMGAVASAVFPAIGTVLAYFFLKEKMKWHQWIFLIITLGGVFALGITPDMATGNFWLGLIGALMCAFGWGIEAVILAKSMKDGEVTDEQALQIRQTTSALFNGIIMIPLVSLCTGNHDILEGWKFTVSLFDNTGWILPAIVIAGLFATVSYLFYYKAINQIGAAKAMALNVTYVAWGIVFSIPVNMWLFQTPFKETLPTLFAVICSVVVLICGIFAAADYKEIFKKK